MKTHEYVHRSLFKALNEKTIVKFEDWHSNYQSTNLFTSLPLARRAYNTDYFNAKIKLDNTYDGDVYAGDDAPNHTGQTFGEQLGEIEGLIFTPGPVPLYGIELKGDPEWGDEALEAINAIDLQFANKTPGNCES